MKRYQPVLVASAAVAVAIAALLLLLLGRGEEPIDPRHVGPDTPVPVRPELTSAGPGATAEPTTVENAARSTIEQSVEVRGIVVDARGEAVAHAWVRGRMMGRDSLDWSAAEVKGETLSGGDGLWVLRIDATGGSLSVSAGVSADLLSDQRVVQLRSVEARRPLRLVVRPPCIVRVVVEREGRAGASVEGVEVTASTSHTVNMAADARGTTGRDGACQLAVPAGFVTIRAAEPNGPFVGVQVQVKAGERRDVVLQVPQDFTRLQVRLSCSGACRSRVQADVTSGTRLASSIQHRLWLDPDGPAASVPVRREGSLRVDLVLPDAPRLSLEWADIEPLVANGVLDIDLGRMERSLVLLVGEDGGPLVGLGVSLVSARNVRASIRATADEAGAISVLGPVGHYAISVGAQEAGGVDLVPDGTPQRAIVSGYGAIGGTYDGPVWEGLSVEVLVETTTVPSDMKTNPGLPADVAKVFKHQRAVRVRGSEWSGSVPWRPGTRVALSLLASGFPVTGAGSEGEVGRRDTKLVARDRTTVLLGHIGPAAIESELARCVVLVDPESADALPIRYAGGSPMESQGSPLALAWDKDREALVAILPRGFRFRVGWLPRVSIGPATLPSTAFRTEQEEQVIEVPGP